MFGNQKCGRRKEDHQVDCIQCFGAFDHLYQHTHAHKTRFVIVNR